MRRDHWAALQVPALDNTMVMQGHADYCETFGHAEYKGHRFDLDRCPRCGVLHEGDTLRNRRGAA